MAKKKVQVEDKKAAGQESAELKNQLARALADYDNLRKRVETEKEIWIKFASERVLIKFISLLDMLEDAQKHLKDQGLGIVINEFRKVFYEEGLEEINPKEGEDFDENCEEAVELVENGEKGKVAETLLVGWKYRDGPILRVAKVKVTKSSQAS